MIYKRFSSWGPNNFSTTYTRTTHAPSNYHYYSFLFIYFTHLWYRGMRFKQYCCCAHLHMDTCWL